MKLWLTTVITGSLFLSVIASLLPENGVKKAALTAFGFVFLAIIVSPVTDAINGGFSLDVLMMESIAETENEEGEDYISSVAREYKARLEQECEAMLETENFTPEITVAIDEDTEQGSFGSIIWVKCLLTKDLSTGESNIKKHYIEKIVIDFDGISTDDSDDTENDTVKEYVEETLSDFLGIKKEAVYVQFG